MNQIKLKGQPGIMACTVTDIPAFPGESFTIAYPEAIGDVAQPFWFGTIKPKWEERANGVLISTGEQAGELSYEMVVTPGVDSVKAEFKLTNHSRKIWKQGMAFNCFQCGAAPSIRDHDCLRHWVRVDGEFKRLREIPRIFGPRPAIQLYSVAGAPLGKDLPFVADFNTTPDVVIEPWMAIRSRDDKKMVATVSKPGLFLFQNREYSCIHCGTGFDEVRPGQTAQAINIVYFVESTLESWHRRMQADLGLLPLGKTTAAMNR
jgi:hypothetical protein